MVKSAVLSDIVAPTGPLAAGSIGHITGYATNTGNENLSLTVELRDYDTGSLVASRGPVSTTPYTPYFSFDFVFTMPNRNFRWYLALHD